MATGKKPAHDASKLLSNPKTPKVKEIAASDLAKHHPKKGK